MSRSPRVPAHARRDAALRRLRRLNRVLIGGAVAATGLLTDVTAHAFSGHSRRAGARTASASGPAPAHTRRPPARAHHRHHAHHRRAALRPPANAPTSAAATTPQATTPQATTPAAPATTTTSGPQPAPTPQPAPAPAPTVSGGS
jgi:hypothetical protein